MPIFMNEKVLIKKVLKNNRVEALPYWELPVHRMTAYRRYYTSDYFITNPLSVTDKVSKKALALPFYNDISLTEINFIVEKIKEAM